MKKILTLFTLLLLVSLTYAKQIDEATARLVGRNFLLNKTK